MSGCARRGPRAAWGWALAALLVASPALADEDGTSADRLPPDRRALPEAADEAPPGDGDTAPPGDAAPDDTAPPDDSAPDDSAPLDDTAPADDTAPPDDASGPETAEDPADLADPTLPEPDEALDDGTAEPEAPAPPYRPYSIPWLLRPLPAVDVVRLDTTLALHDAYGPIISALTATVAQVLTMSFRVADGVALVMRQGWAYTHASSPNFTAFLLGFNLSVLLDPTVRLSVFLGTTVPQGGLNTDPANRDARLARLAFENAMWLPNYLAGIAGVGVGWIDGGWTLQAEATLFVLGRLYGEVDDAIVNATFGASIGYFITRELSLSGELHHQHFLSSPRALSRVPPADYGSDLQSQTSVSLGARVHVNVEGRVWFRPGLSWGIGSDAPLAGDEWQVIQLDLPLVF